MDQTFHYEIIKVLAEKAGFRPDEAQIIAYSSQFVDDGTIENKYYLNGFSAGTEFQSLYDSGSHIFSPVQTAHEGVQNLEALSPDGQKKVLVSFHFIPNEKIAADRKKYFLTKENGELANSIINQAVSELKKSTSANRVQKLIKLGIAVHTYADSWAHDDFAGIKYALNKKRDCQVLVQGNWQNDLPVGIVKIGHAPSRSPDGTTLKWRYKNAGVNNLIEKDNTIRFLTAAEEIFKVLNVGTNTGIAFTNIRDDIHAALELGNPQGVFSDINLRYIKSEWKDAAVRFNLPETRRLGNYWVYDFQGDMKWFWFQLEALNQRQFVLSNLL